MLFRIETALEQFCHRSLANADDHALHNACFP